MRPDDSTQRTTKTAAATDARRSQRAKTRERRDDGCEGRQQPDGAIDDGRGDGATTDRLEHAYALRETALACLRVLAEANAEAGGEGGKKSE